MTVLRHVFVYIKGNICHNKANEKNMFMNTIIKMKFFTITYAPYVTAWVRPLTGTMI